MHVKQKMSSASTTTTTTKKNKMNRIRRQLVNIRKTQFAHMLNATIQPNAFETVFQRAKELKRKHEQVSQTNTETDTSSSSKKAKVYKKKPNEQTSAKQRSPREYLQCIGIENKKDYRNWMKLFHPDKNKDEDADACCAKVMQCASTVRLQ